MSCCYLDRDGIARAHVPTTSVNRGMAIELYGGRTDLTTLKRLCWPTQFIDLFEIILLLESLMMVTEQLAVYK